MLQNVSNERFTDGFDRKTYDAIVEEVQEEIERKRRANPNAKLRKQVADTVVALPFFGEITSNEQPFKDILRFIDTPPQERRHKLVTSGDHFYVRAQKSFIQDMETQFLEQNSQQ